ncbi:hypothetical protein [Acidocella facilis]|uniref:hypothetical protein n=1 Tax=Acidocella facilis TaxID=525 RepID=UPI001F17FFBB|nr:hypothetical protein [Acidocella facilis]
MTDWSTISAQEKAEILRSLTSVGPKKAVGYLPLYTIRDILRLQPEQVAREAEDEGLRALIIDTARIKSGALYVYHQDTLSRLLLKFEEIVVAANAPIDPDKFIELIAYHQFEPNHPLYRIIASAFNDNSFPIST